MGAARSPNVAIATTRDYAGRIAPLYTYIHWPWSALYLLSYVYYHVKGNIRLGYVAVESASFASHLPHGVARYSRGRGFMIGS